MRSALNCSGAWQWHRLGRMGCLRCACMVPVTLSLALILLTSLVLVEARALNIWRDPEDLALVYIFPTIFIAVFFGSSVAVMSSFAGALAAAYFIYPPYDSILVDDPRHIAELGFFLLLAITGSIMVAVLKEGPLKPPLRAGNLGRPTAGTRIQNIEPFRLFAIT
jgi:K+-sensing histidine kinase KdpD